MELRKLAKKVTTALFLSVFNLIAFAQNLTVTGNVKDNIGESIIGVNVQVVGTTTGTITDFNGNYSIQAPANSKLQFSFIGYVSHTVAVNNQESINVILKENATDLEEIVVIGYGTVRRKDLTGAVASISNDQLVANPVTNVAQALQGHLPGVSVMSQDGRPDATVSIRIRGGGSITQSNDPLFVVDGFPVSSISDIPADQIESIDVLKDAASTAVYGARGANGVILITTKGGKEGKVQVTYNAYLQTKSVAKVNKGLDAQDYIYTNWAFAAALGETYRKGMEEYFGLGSANGNHYADYAGVTVKNWSEEVLRTTLGQNHSLSLSGGSKMTKIMFNLNYADDEGIQMKSGYTRYNASLKIQQEISKTLKMDMDVRYAQVNVDGRFGNDWVSGSYVYRPILEPLGTGNFSGFGNGAPNVDPDQDIIKQIEATERIRQRVNFRGMASLTWDIIKHLTAKTDLVLGRNYNENKDYYDGYIGTKTASIENKDGYNFRSATTLNWQLPLGKNHNASIMAGQEVMISKSNSITIGGQGYPDTFDKNMAWGMINNTDKKADTWTREVGVPSKTLSFFGRGNYSYLGRYLFSATFRADGSSKFAPDHRWGYFPAAAAAWRISDESFLENTKEWLDNLKIRLSYGTSGADGIDSNLWKETWTTQELSVDGQTVIGYKPGDMRANSDLKWETTISRNLGIDFGFWNNKLHGSAELYWNTTKNLLLRVPIDTSTGYSYQYQNVGKTSNKGLELALSFNPIRTKDFSLSISGVYNYNKNNVDELSDKVKTTYRTGWGSTMKSPYDDYVLQVGRPVGLVRGYVFDGFYSVDDFVYTNGIYTLKAGVPDYSADVIRAYPGRDVFNGMLPDGQMAFPGALKLRNMNDDDIVNMDDVTILGEVMAKHTGGLNMSATYKSFDFSASFAYQIGGKVYNATAMNSLVGGKDDGLGKNRLDVIKNAYRIYDINNNGDLVAVTDPEALNALNTKADMPLPFYENAIVLSNWLEDASFLRLNTLTIGYTLPKTWIRKWGCQNFRVYATAGNLFTITGYSGMDPEVNTSPTTDGFPTLGYDYNTYPRAKTFTFGLNLAF